MKPTLLTLLALIFTLSAFSQSKKREVISDAFDFEGSFIGDFMYNMDGGIETGTAYLALFNLKVGFDTEKAGLWSGGRLFLNAANTHGHSPSGLYLGDFQGASNIDAGDHSFAQELWYSHTFDKFNLIVGLQDLNVMFANSSNGALFVNSSFGILPTISANTAAPIFPLTTLGISTEWIINDNLTWANAIHDGEARGFDPEETNFNWDFEWGDGVLMITEFQYHSAKEVYETRMEIGAYSQNHLAANIANKELADSICLKVYGFFATIDQNIWTNGNQHFDAFTQLGYSPSKNSVTDIYLGLGLNFTGLFSEEGYDELGLALAMQRFKIDKSKETVIELTYKYQILRNIFLQPDIQYIINPSGTDEELDNAFVGFLRVGLEF